MDNKFFSSFHSLKKVDRNIQWPQMFFQQYKPRKIFIFRIYYKENIMGQTIPQRAKGCLVRFADVMLMLQEKLQWCDSGQKISIILPWVTEQQAGPPCAQDWCRFTNWWLETRYQGSSSAYVPDGHTGESSLGICSGAGIEDHINTELFHIHLSPVSLTGDRFKQDIEHDAGWGRQTSFQGGPHHLPESHQCRSQPSDRGNAKASHRANSLSVYFPAPKSDACHQ